MGKKGDAVGLDVPLSIDDRDALDNTSMHKINQATMKNMALHVCRKKILHATIDFQKKCEELCLEHGFTARQAGFWMVRHDDVGESFGFDASIYLGDGKPDF